MAKILIFGDIMGRPGRKGVTAVLSSWKDQHRPDVIIGNVENLVHGKGITLDKIEELNALGFDAYTSGNHAFDSGPSAEECFAEYHQIIRPANYLSLLGHSGEKKSVPGVGSYRFAKNGQQYLLMNFSGRVFMEESFKGEMSNPFFMFDELYQQNAQKDDIIIVDLHAEASSEKEAFGWHLDGRASIVYGTHTHVPTADTKKLPKSTVYQGDVGMVGALDSVIGVVPENALKLFLEQDKFRVDIPEDSVVIVNALLVEIIEGSPVKMERLQTEIK
jgi:2',3'-cyclic-nucleotide 2'-phosphodiesterase